MKNGKDIQQILQDCPIPVSAMYEKKIVQLETRYKQEIKHWRFSFMSCFVALILVSIIAIIAILKIIN
jgi:hypothetical protein